MATRKIELMHKLFGKSDGLCKECCNYTRYRYRDKAYRKCTAYGVTRSESSDWKASYQACGLFNREYNGKDVIRLVTQDATKRVIAEPIEGQESIFREESKESEEMKDKLWNIVNDNIERMIKDSEIE